MRPGDWVSASSLLILGLTLPAAIVGPRALAQATQPPTPTIQVYSAETIVDVTVTDAKGNPVHGLQRSDFTVEQDGKSQAIRSFQEFSAAPASAQPAPALPPSTYTNRQSAPADGALNIVLIDLLRMTPLTDGIGDSFSLQGLVDSFAAQTRVKQGAEQYLKTMPPGTRVAVLSLTPGHLSLLQDFTSDRDLLSAVVHDVRVNTAGMAASSAVVTRANSGPGGVRMPTTDQEITCMVQSMRDRTTFEALNQLSASLASIKGKKNLMWFSPGFPTLTDPSFNVIEAGGCLPDYSVGLNKTLALLAAAQVAVYPISTTRVHEPDIDTNPASPTAGYSITAAQNLSLEAMAEATGGVAYHDTNDLAGALAKAVQTGANYYALSYAPPEAKFDTRRHSIAVHTRLSGVHLTYRDTYVAEDPRLYAPAPTLGIGAALPHAATPTTANPAPSANPAAALRAAMAHGAAESTQILFDVHVDPGVAPTQSSDPSTFGTLAKRFKGKLLTRYSFRSSLDSHQLALNDDDMIFHGAVDFTLAAFDAEGKQITALTQTVTIRLGDYGYTQFLQAPFSLLQQLDLPTGRFFLRAGIFDRVSGKIGTLEFPLDVPNLTPIPHNPPAAPPAAQVYPRETTIDVLVTNDKGQPVRGLMSSDFTVVEEGHSQRIRSLTEVDRNTSPPPGAPLPSNTYTNAYVQTASGPVNIFLFDRTHTHPDDLVRVKPSVADYLGSMPQGTQVVLFALSPGGGLNLLLGLTTDGRLAASALENLDAERSRMPLKSDPIASLDQVAAYVAGIPGRKNLIWITRSPLMITSDGGLSWASGTTLNQIAFARLMDTYARFTAEQIAVYPFNPAAAGDADIDIRKAENVAQDTGGTAINKTNNIEDAIAKIVEDTSHYYTLSYIPPRPNYDGSHHAVTISVDRPGLNLVYPSGYDDQQPMRPDPKLQVQMSQATMGRGALPSTQIIFNLRVQPSPLPSLNAANSRRPLPTELSYVPYNVLYHLDPAQIPFIQTPDNKRTTSLEFDLVAYNSAGKVVAINSQTLKLALTPGQYAGFVRTPLQQALTLDLPPGQLTLRAGVFDGTLNKIGTLELPLNVPNLTSIRRR